MASILVTGGAGFIGSHLVDRLIKENEKVIVLDNLSSGKKENINQRAIFYKIDIRDKNIEKIFKKEKPRRVYHLASQVSVIDSIKNPIKDLDINVAGTVNILNNCIKYNIKKIIYSSTGGALYGKPDYLPADEKHSIKPLCPYGQSKAVSEQYILLFNRTYGINYLILRYGNVYGPRQDPLGEAGIMAIFIDKLLKNKKPIIFGDGNQTRDFIYVDDVIDSNISLDKGIFNIATGKETTINKVTSSIITNLNSKIKPIYEKPRRGEVNRIYLDIRKAQEHGWNPKVRIMDGIKKTIDYFLEKNGNNQR